MKKNSSIVVVVVAMLLCWLTLLSLAGATEVKVVPETQEVNIGGAFQVHVDVADVANLKAPQAYLWFNHSAMQVTGVTEGAFLPSIGAGTAFTFKLNNTEGWVKFMDAYFPATNPFTGEVYNVSGSGRLATINFTAGTYEGVYDLNLTDVILVNVTDNTIPRDVTNGTVNITAPTGPVLCTDPDPPSHPFGDVPEGQTRAWNFDITNCGDQSILLTWNVGDDRAWITETPPSGSTTTETDTVTVRVDTTGLSLGLHTGTITVTSNDGTESGTISVNVTAPVAPAAVPGLSGTGMIALIGVLAAVLAVSVSSAMRRRKK